jgi:hypothetical protein
MGDHKATHGVDRSEYKGGESEPGRQLGLLSPGRQKRAY